MVAVAIVSCVAPATYAASAPGGQQIPRTVIETAGTGDVTFSFSGRSEVTIDANGCAALKTLELSDNELVSIDVGGCTALEKLMDTIFDNRRRE